MKTATHIPLTDVERKAIEEAARRLKAELPVSHVVLFGSKARGTGDEGSDIDLLILTTCEVTGPIRDAAYDILHQIGFPADLFLSCLVEWEKDWDEGLIHYMLIHDEVERDGIEL